MQNEYVSPDFKIFMFLPKEKVALVEDNAASDPNHDNGYVDWFADPDASRRGTQD